MCYLLLLRKLLQKKWGKLLKDVLGRAIKNSLASGRVWWTFAHCQPTQPCAPRAQDSSKMFRSRSWFGGGWNRPKNRLSLDHLKYLYSVLERNTTVSESNRGLLVESLRSIAEILIWGDQNDSSVFEWVCQSGAIGLTFVHCHCYVVLFSQLLSGKEYALLLSAHNASKERRIELRVRAAAANAKHPVREHPQRDVAV